MSGITLCSYKTINAHLTVSSSLLSTLFHFFKPLPSHNPFLSLLSSSVLAWFALWNAQLLSKVPLSDSPCHQLVCLFSSRFRWHENIFQPPRHSWTPSTGNVVYFFQQSTFDSSGMSEFLQLHHLHSLFIYPFVQTLMAPGWCNMYNTACNIQCKYV